MNRTITAPTDSSAQRIPSWLWAVVVLSFAASCLPLFLFPYFSYEHAWVSAHFATMARTFIEHGAYALHFTPIQNSGPLTTEPDYYIHWPPLFPVLVSWLAEWVTGGRISEALIHSISLILIALQASLLGIWLARRTSPLAALFAVMLFLNIPVVTRFAHAGLHLHLALLLGLAATLVFHQTVLHPRLLTWRLPVGLMLYASACFTSWEPFLLLPGFAVYWLVERNRQRFMLVMLYGLGALLSLASVMFLYTQSFPGLINSLLNRALFRAGMIRYTDGGSTAIHELANTSSEGPPNLIWRLFPIATNLQQLGLIAAFALAGLIWLWMKRSQRRAPTPPDWLALAPLLSQAVLWVLLMSQHFMIHNYQTLIFALPIGLSTGFIIHRIITGPTPLSALATWSIHRKALLVLLCSVLILGPRIAVEYKKYASYGTRDHWIALGSELQHVTPANAVILVPWDTMVASYYSERHLVRAVTPGIYLQRQQQFLDLCSDCPLYVVADPNTLDSSQYHAVIALPGKRQLLALNRMSPSPGVSDALPTNPKQTHD